MLKYGEWDRDCQKISLDFAHRCEKLAVILLCHIWKHWIHKEFYSRGTFDVLRTWWGNSFSQWSFSIHSVRFFFDPFATRIVTCTWRSASINWEFEKSITSKYEKYNRLRTFSCNFTDSLLTNIKNQPTNLDSFGVFIFEQDLGNFANQLSHRIDFISLRVIYKIGFIRI